MTFLFSSRALKLRSKLYKLCVLFGAAVVEVDKKSETLIPSPIGYQRLVRNIKFVGLYLIFQIVQAILAKRRGDLSSFNLCTIFLYSFALLEISLVILMYDGGFDYARGINQIYLFAINLKKFYMPNYDPEKDERNRIFDTFMILGILVLGAGQFVFLSHSLLFPSTPFQVSSVIPYNYFTALPIFFVNFNLVCFFTLNLYEHLLVYGYYQIFAIGTLKELQIRRGTFSSKADLRTLSKLTLCYRSVQITNGIPMELYGMLLPFSQAVFTQLILISSFMLIKHFNDVNSHTAGLLLIFGITSFVIWTTILIYGGKFYREDKTTLLSWKLNYHLTKQIDRKYLAKFRKSCRPLCFGYLDLYRITNLSILKFWKGVIRGIFRSLLALKGL